MIFVVGGGGGGLSNKNAVLVVTVPAGSTVTAVKGNDSLKPTMWTSGSNASLECAIFNVPSTKFDSTTPWTVTSSLGSDSASNTVLINTNKKYEMELNYYFSLFDNGSIADTVGSFDVYGNATIGSIIDCKYDAGYGAGFTTHTAIDLTPYSKLTFVFTGYTKLDGYPLVFGVTTTQKVVSGSSDQHAKFAVKVTPSQGDTQAIVDISNITTCYVAGAGVGSAKISRIYVDV